DPGAEKSAEAEARRGRQTGTGGTRRCRAPRQGRCLSVSALRRSAATRRDRTCAGPGAEDHAVRRADQRPRSGAGRRRAQRDAGDAQIRHDHGRGQPRNALRARSRRSRDLHGSGRDRRRGTARRDLRQCEAPANAHLPPERARRLIAAMDQIVANFFDLEVIARYLPDILSGFVLTIYLAVAIVLFGLALGLALAVVRAFQIRPLNWLIVFFVDLFRALPPLVIMIIFYFALPYVGVELGGFVAAWLALGFVLAAFAEEIYWAGILSADKGQWEAARSTGLPFFRTLRWVVLPQALRLTIPPLTNRTIAITKGTALASVVTVPEILSQATAAQAFAANTSPLTMGAIAYLILFAPLVTLSRWIETRFAWRR